MNIFTLEQVNEIHDRFGNADTLGAYLKALREIGVERSDSFITDGHTVHYGKDGYSVTTPPAHQAFKVAEASSQEKFLSSLDETNYEKMSKSLADSGVEKWTFDTTAMTMTYYDSKGKELLIESIQ